MKTKIPIVTAPILAMMALCGCEPAGHNPATNTLEPTSPSANQHLAGTASNMTTIPPALHTNNLENPATTNMPASNPQKQ